jgi:hypothetical protein
MATMIRSTQGALVLALALAVGPPVVTGWVGPDDPGQVVPSQPQIDLWHHGLAAIGSGGDGGITSGLEDANAVEHTFIDMLRADAGAVAAVEARPSLQRWSVRARPQIDLWYHGLAIIGVEREELLSMYDREYAGAIAQAKRARGIAATRLDSLADYFRSQFESSSEFRFLDQLALFFEDATLEQMLAALEAVADRQIYRRDKVSAVAREGAAAAAQVFDRVGLRRVLKRYIEALRQEWDVFYGQYWVETIAPDSTSRSALDDFWATSVAPRLADFLTERRMDGGTIVLSAAVGPQGRLFIGAPDNNEDNLMIVWSRPGASPREPAYYAVKEICYAVVGPALEELVEEKVENISLRMTAAVRCGALVLDRYAPVLAARYRRTMMRSVGADTVTATIGRFEERFSLEPEILTALQDEIDRR